MEEQRIHREPIPVIYRLVFSVVVSLMVQMLIGEKPLGNQQMQQIEHINTKFQRIFETSLANITSVYSKRIMGKEDNLWTYIPFHQYIISPKWVDVQYTFTSRIGFKIDAQSNSVVTYDSETQKVNVLDPDLQVLSVDYTSKVIKQSNSFLNSWEIQQFQNRKSEVAEHITGKLQLQAIAHLEAKYPQFLEGKRQIQTIIENRENSVLRYLRLLNKFIGKDLFKALDQAREEFLEGEREMHFETEEPSKPELKQSKQTDKQNSKITSKSMSKVSQFSKDQEQKKNYYRNLSKKNR